MHLFNLIENSIWDPSDKERVENNLTDQGNNTTHQFKY